MIIINKLKVLSLLILSGILITPTQLTRAEEIYNVSEADLIKLLEKYKNEEVVMAEWCSGKYVEQYQLQKAGQFIIKMLQK